MENTFNIFELINSIIAIILLITWFVGFKHILKISKKLHSTASLSTIKFEAEVAEYSGNNQKAAEMYIRLALLEYNERYEIALYENKVENLKSEIKLKYLDLIQRNGGKLPESLSTDYDHQKQELNNIEAFYKNGLYTELEYEIEKDKILNSKK